MTGVLKPNYPPYVCLSKDSIKQIGNTPLLEIRNIYQHPKIKILAKAEWTNAGGSIKARPALNMILNGLEKGTLKKDKIIFDSTSGNTGIAYAFIGAAMGFNVTLVMPENVSKRRKEIITDYHAEIIYSSALEGSDGAMRLAEKILNENPEKYFFPDQYGNEANWQAHYETTAKEIYQQTKGMVTHFLAGMGTSGTLMGTGKGLKRYDEKIKAISVQPDASLHGLEGMKHMASSIVPTIYDESFPDRQIDISTDDAYDMVDLLREEEGLKVGYSSGANLCAAIKLAKELESSDSDSEATIVTVFADSTACYNEYL
ncbi:MAG: cysteine synthase family protein [Nitrospinae bacterium]|nr:cysteine synthase family protein [Nitrospinota bacterium]